MISLVKILTLDMFHLFNRSTIHHPVILFRGGDPKIKNSFWISGVYHQLATLPNSANPRVCFSRTGLLLSSLRTRF